MARRFRRTGVCSSSFISLACLILPSTALAAGLGNLTYTQAELQKPIANFGGEGQWKWPTGPGGSNTALMLRNVFVVMGSRDSGATPGSFHIYDVKDPRNPKLLKTYDNTPETNQLRELHAMPVAMIDGKDVLVVPTTDGIQFFDFTDPLNPAPAGHLALEGVKGGDYDNTVWMLSWAWPYVYVGATGNGVYVVDATEPSKPSVVTKIATGELGNFKVGPTYAAGNYLVVSNMDQKTTQFSVIDVGAPKTPFLLATGSISKSLYSSLVVGDRIYGAGTNGDYAFLKWNTSSITELKGGKSGGDRGGYCTYQSGFTVCGQSSEGYKKWDTRDENNPQLVGQGTDPNGAGGDFDFATILGNLVYLGNDHGTGAALIPHTMEPDGTAPEVVKIFPSNGDVKQPTSTRVTVFFSEDVDLDSVNAENIVVREVGGGAVAGVFSRSSFNAISFGSKQPLTADKTYEVALPAGGVKDLVGNALATASSVRFSTGAVVDGMVSEPPAGGAAGSAGSPMAAGSGSVVPSGGAPMPSGGSAPTAGTSSTTGGVATGGLPNGDVPLGEPTGGTAPAGCTCSAAGHSPSALSWLPAALAASLGSRRSRRRREAERR